MPMPLIEIESLTKSYGALRALDGLSLDLEHGEWIAVTGPSGSGKTTLLNILAGLDRPSGGRILVDGNDLSGLTARGLARYRRHVVGLVFQQFHLIPYLSALENVMLAQYVHSVTDRGEAEEALRAVGLGDRLAHLPRELSGGEQQRVCIARALINRPKIILADEPTGNLDGVNEAVVMSLLTELHRQGHALVLVTHDPAIAARADREVRLEHGRRAAPKAPEAIERQALLVELWRLIAEDEGRVAVGRRGVAEAMADGVLHFAEGRLSFTVAGGEAAVDAIRRSRLAEALAAHTLAQAPQRNCGEVEPIAPAVVDQVCAFLGHPLRCPHGRAIPRGIACCPPAS
ncbi:MAG: ATP-binding cassette domain-containing protein [Acidobacteriota bacterium]